MSYECVKAIKGQSCTRCGRLFSSNELIFTDAEGDLICIESCWRTRAAKVIPFRRPAEKSRATRMLAPEKQVAARATRTPVVRDETHAGLMTDILKKEIEEMTRSLKKGE